MKSTHIAIAEWVISLLLTMTVICLLAARLTHGGGLWRDECGSVQLALMPTWGEIWRHFTFEAFPLLFPASVRGYAGLFGTSNLALRSYGFTVGLLLLTVLWINAWWLQRRPPLLALALLGLNPVVLIWGTAVRGYGPASVLIVLLFGVLSQIQRTPTWGWVSAGLVVALASVQTALHNCFLLAALCLSAAIPALLRREWRTAALILGIGLICALSMLPYVPSYTSVEWNVVEKTSIGFLQLLGKFCRVLAEPVGVMFAVWGTLLLTAVSGALFHLFRRREHSFMESPLLAYGLLTVLLAPLAYFTFLKLVSYPTQTWYYLMLLCLLASTIDALLGPLAASDKMRVARLFVAGALLLWLPWKDWPLVQVRQTNIDLIATRLEAAAGANDLIVVNPWYVGVTFSWYFHGQTRWVTVPILEDVRVHRYDLLQAKMASPDPLADLESAIATTLRSGRAVWLVGYATPTPQPILRLPPAPYSRYGWSDQIYSIAWTNQIEAYLRAHAPSIIRLIDPAQHAPVYATEDLSVWKISGWRDAPAFEAAGR